MLKIQIFSESMSKRNNVCFFVLNAVVIYILIYFSAYHIPFHSDDYVFTLRGISLQAHLNHYLNWEGRIIGDYIASLLLNLFSKPVYMAINTLVFLSVVINISLIPLVLQGRSWIHKDSSLFLWISFMMYWLCNPNLGQTSFWIVGSAIYLWPLMWLSFYLLYLFKLLAEETKQLSCNSCKQTFVLCILGFFSGLSNEATGAVTVFFTLFLLFIYQKGLTFSLKDYSCVPNGQLIDDRCKILLKGLLSSLAGFLLLILAPGNFVRLSTSFPAWESTPLGNKIVFHLLWRVPDAISRFWLAFLIISVILVYLSYYLQKDFKKLKLQCFVISISFLIISAFSIFMDVKMQYKSFVCISLVLFFVMVALAEFLNSLISCSKCEETIFAYLKVAFIFLILALFSIMIFLVSPYSPPRVFNTCNFFIVLTVITLLQGIILNRNGTNQYKYKFICLVSLLLITCFLFSYIRFAYAVVQTDIQAEIRNALILRAKAKGCNEVQIPGWYFTKLARQSDKFDTWHCCAMQEYYEIENIVIQTASFNYAILKTKQPIIDNLKLTDQRKMRLYYNDSISFFDEPCFVLELEKPLNKNIKDRKAKISFGLHIGDQTKIICIDNNSEGFNQFGDWYYYIVKLNNINKNTISKIDINYEGTSPSAICVNLPK